MYCTRTNYIARGNAKCIIIYLSEIKMISHRTKCNINLLYDSFLKTKYSKLM